MSDYQEIVVSGMSGGGPAVEIPHEATTLRDAEDSHPIEAITNLETRLSDIDGGTL